MTLSTLSHDALTHIWSWLEARDILQLYCIGDSAFTPIFKRVPMPPMIFECQTRFLYGRLPAFFVEIGPLITHFELRTSCDLVERAFDGGLRLQSMPNLRTLILHTHDAERMLYGDFYEQDSLAMRTAYADALLQSGLKGTPRMMDLHKFFPKLEKLDVKAVDTIFGPIDYCVIHKLPLTWFAANHNLKLGDEIFHFLPPTLTHLQLNGFHQLDPSFPALPANLEVLQWDLEVNESDLRHRVQPTLTRANIERLPPNLIELRIASGRFPSELIPFLPSKLQRFASSQYASLSEISELPPNLKSLDLPLAVSPSDSSSAVFPASLTKLHVNVRLFNTETIDWKFLPSSLRYLRVGSSGDVQPSAPPLPDGIVQYVTTAKQSLSGTWPLGLERLVVGGPSSLDKLPLTLPSSLVLLQCGDMWDLDLAVLPRSLTRLQILKLINTDANIVKKFPPALTHFEAVKASLSADEINTLPKTLLKLKISSWFADEDVPSIANCRLPPGLRSLSLRGRSAPLTSEDVANLPRSLTSLAVSGLPSESFSALPAGLQRLELVTASGDLGANIRHLPRQLYYLSIFSGTFASKWLRFLPRTLVWAHFSSDMVLDPRHIPHLPVQLQLRHGTSASEYPKDLLHDYYGPYNPVTRELYLPEHRTATSEEDDEDEEVADVKKRKKACIIS